jgi:phosphopentomutase
LIVLDGTGAGEAPDAKQFGDSDQPSTLLHVWNAAGGIDAPTLARAGLFAAGGIDECPASPGACYGRLRPMSKGGKDSVTGHWEMMGIVTNTPFPTYPNGFPQSLIDPFEARIGCKILGNVAASGTQIIQELGSEHVRTGQPIVYTSADSVFQIACHEDVVDVDRLYQMCRIARELCIGENSVQRIIARPFVGDSTKGFVRTERRKDFPLAPPPNLIDRIGDVAGIGVVPELFDYRGFRKLARTQSNAEHEKALNDALESDARFIFANFEDFDMLYGHRNDPLGFARCLEGFDETVAGIIPRLREGDLLILTADHGNDPTTPSTDHSREFVPAVLVGGSGRPFGDVDGFGAIGSTVAAHLGLEWPGRNLNKP